MSAARSRGLGRRLFAGIFLGLLVYAALVLWGDAPAMGAALAAFPLWLIPVAMGLSFANYLVRFLRWERYRRLIGVELETGTSLLIYLAGLSLTITPGKLGEAFKSWLIRRVDGTPVHATAPIVVAERFTDLLAFLVLVALGGLATRPENAWIFWVTLGLCAVLLGLASSERVALSACDLVEKLPFGTAVAPRARGAFASTRVLLAPSELVMPTVVATLGWGLECIGFWLVANALVSEPVSFLFATYAFALAAVAGAVLLIFPGGLGVTEGTLSGLLEVEYKSLGLATGAARAKAATATMIIRFATLWFAVGVGLVALVLFERRFGRIDVAGQSVPAPGRGGEQPEHAP